MKKKFKNIFTGVIYLDSFHNGRRVLIEENDTDHYLPLTTRELELLDVNGEVIMENWGDVHLQQITR